MKAKRFIQYYDENRNELCGSDSIWVFDQRWSIDTIMDKVITKAEKQAAYYRANPDKAVPQHAAYARLMHGEILCASPITGFVNLEHN